MATLIENGNLRFVFQHRLVVQGTESRAAAEAVECAGEQGKFWAYHDKLYRNQRVSGGFSKANLIAFAKDSGLDTQQFTTCFADRTYKDRVTAQDAAAAKAGVRATPTFSLNGRLIEGLLPGDGLKALIDAEISKAK